MKTKLFLSAALLVGAMAAKAQLILWGLAANGGSNYGTLFAYDVANDSVQVKYKFKGNFLGDGAFPKGSLILASNNKMYGMTYSGGSANGGLLFEFDPASNTYTQKVHFGSNQCKGTYPSGDLFQASNGKLYGLTQNGGINGGSTGDGVLFEYDITTNTITTLFNFDGTAHGRFPFGSVIQGTDGKLYGLTSQGGVSDYGVIFCYDISAGTMTNKHDFANTSDGGKPNGSLVQAPNGKMYGLALNGAMVGTGYGTIFEYDPATDGYATLFGNFVGNSGQLPYGSFCQASNGKMYATTHDGGTSNNGIILEFNLTDSSVTNVHSFSNANGAYPMCTLLQASDGKLYGGTTQGGPNGTTMGEGVLFSYDPATGTFVNLHNMSQFTDGKNITYTKLLEYNSVSNGVKEIKDKVQLSLWPNPATESLTVNFSGKDNVSFRILNTQGAEILSGALETKTNIDIHELPAGIYFIQAAGVARKFVKM